MEGHSAHDMQAHVKVYFGVFFALLVLTVVTVAVSYLEVSVPVGIAIGLFVASIKATLVACYFMHLIDEKKVIYWSLILTVIFFTANRWPTPEPLLSVKRLLLETSASVGTVS